MYSSLIIVTYTLIYTISVARRVTGQGCDGKECVYGDHYLTS
jgi:hypothetical protein